jgi:hypothetical protein
LGDELRMSGKERARLVELERVMEGRQSLGEAARRLGVSYRQVKRVWGRYRKSGALGLVHGGRGRSSNRGYGAVLKARCMEVYRERLEGFGPTLASEKLAEWGVAEVDHETLRRWLSVEGLWRRERRRGPHRQWRQRRARCGELVQVDGSHHDWFESGERACLMNLVDDASGTTLGRMYAQETTEAAMQMLWTWIERYGVPLALYCDRKTVYITDREPTAEEQLAGQEPMTAFGLACHRLGIVIIAANSPQAKGRVERNHGVYQDRLVKELRLRGITSIEGANELLDGGFVARLNAKFAKSPLDPEDAHRQLTPGVELASIFVFEETRGVANDWTIRYHNRWYQITGPRERMPRPRATITVQRRLDGSLHLLYRGQVLSFREVPLEARVVPPHVKSHVASKPRASQPARPRPDHPWQRPFSRRVLAAQAASPPDPPRSAHTP